MKTVSGKITSTKPTSLSNAARILSKFASSEIGASQAIGAYLRRASFAFNELDQLHNELKSPAEGKQKVDTIDEYYANGKVEEGSKEEEIIEADGGKVATERGVERGINSERKKHKKMKNVEKNSHGAKFEVIHQVKNEDQTVEKKKKRKKAYEVREGGDMGSEDNKSKKKKIKIKTEDS